MVQILVNNFCTEDVYSVYDIALGNSVWDLKTEIEETEGLPAGSQRLEFEGQTLGNEDKLERYSVSEGSLIFLRRAPVFLNISHTISKHTPKREDFECMDELGKFNYNHSSFTVKPDQNIVSTQAIALEVDLNATLSEFKSFLVNNMQEFVLQPQGIELLDAITLYLSIELREQPLDNLDKTLFESCVRDCDTMHISYNIYDGPYPIEFRDMGSSIYGSSYESLTRVDVLHSWDGDMKHPRVQGLPLKKGVSFDCQLRTGLYYNWYYHKTPCGPRYFPCNYVTLNTLNERLIRDWQSSQEPIPATTDEVPPLPEFFYPEASPMEFLVKIADGGHSLVNVSLEYDNFCSPNDPTFVKVKLICKAFGSRRISAISIHITIPEDKVIDIQPKERTDSEDFVSEIAVRERETTEYGLKSLGVNLPAGLGVEVGVGATKGKDREVAQKGTMSSRKIITGCIIRKNTVCWDFREAATAWGGNGLKGEQGEMWFILRGKPDRFEYDCRITHVKDQKERTKRAMSKPWFQRRFG